MRTVRVAVLFSLVMCLILVAVPPGGAHAANGRILVATSNQQIATMRPDGSGFRVLVENDQEPGGATWSPDHTMFAWTQLGGEDEDVDIFVRNVRGGRRQLIGSGNGGYSWSPDGRYIAYVGITDSGQLLGTTCYGIWVADVETGVARAVGHAPDCKAWDPRWSPAGGEIAFVDGQDEGTIGEEHDIYVADVVTGEVHRLTNASGIDEAPEWAPDGSKIVFASNRGDTSGNLIRGCLRRYEIYVMKADGSHERPVTVTPNRADCVPLWSPDGKRITYLTFLPKRGETSRSPELHIVRVDGSHDLPLTDEGRLESFAPAFSRDGRWIVFLGMTAEHSDLYKIRPDGTHRIRLTHGDGHAGRPAW